MQDAFVCWCIGCGPGEIGIGLRFSTVFRDNGKAFGELTRRANAVRMRTRGIGLFKAHAAGHCGGTFTTRHSSMGIPPSAFFRGDDTYESVYDGSQIHRVDT